jgi:hypothetical protein
MRFLRPLLGLTRLDRQRNPEIRNSLKLDNIVEDIKQYQRRWVDHLERMDKAAYRGWPSSTNLGDGGIGEDREQDGRTRNTLSFKETGLKT